MNSKLQELKELKLKEQEAKKLKGGYTNIDFGGAGGFGFIIWDDLDPRDSISAKGFMGNSSKFKKG